jgi:hypothetical protein
MPRPAEATAASSMLEVNFVLMGLSADTAIIQGTSGAGYRSQVPVTSL